MFFQIRGAMNAVLQLLNSLPEDQKPVLVTHSSGNHAQAIALSAKIMGLKASIAMPRNAPLVKKAAVRDYGATIVDCGVSGEVFHKPKIDCVLPENICTPATGFSSLFEPSFPPLPTHHHLSGNSRFESYVSLI